MSLISLPGLDALANHRNQTYSYWVETANRIKSGIVLPFHHPKFQLHEDDKLFVMGSCFARRLEQAFSRREMNCINSKEFALASTDIFGKLVNVNYQNKYSTHSILNELRWALDPSYPFPKEAIVLDQKNAIDLQAAPHLGEFSLPVADLQEVYHRHIKLLTGVTRKLREADIFVITLGLVELWFDHETNLFTNAGLLASLLEKEPERYSFEVSTFSENIANLEEIYSLLKRYCKPDLKIIVTVSPVPMAATFSGRDIPIANTYSKSVLRAVAEEWKNLHDNVDYFPSYEMVMLSDYRLAFEEDVIHVSDSFADVIVKNFFENYFKVLIVNQQQRLENETPNSIWRRGLQRVKCRLSIR